jgi:DNA primase
MSENTNVAHLRNTIVLSEMIGRDVRLQRRGTDFWGCCPFHKEKTPSFKVDDDRKSFHCFGCGAHGDAIGYVMTKQNIGFKEALEILLEQQGIIHSANHRRQQYKTGGGGASTNHTTTSYVAPQTAQQATSQATPPYPSQPSHSQTTPQQYAASKSESARLQDVMEKAAQYFHATLKTSTHPDVVKARAYLSSRGIPKDTIDSFCLGYCNNETVDFLKKINGINQEILNDTGLVITKNSGEVARFAGRVIFPIYNTFGRVIAFGGRIISNLCGAKGFRLPKYLNSPETPLFHKGDVLFNLHNAIKHTKTSELIVVEGYMDVVAMSQHNFPQTVASLGTAITENQIRKAWQFSSHPILCFDGDAAGQKAAQRAALRCLPILESGKSLFFCFLPTNCDPDEFVNNHGEESMRAMISRAVPLVDVLWNNLLQKYADNAKLAIAKLYGTPPLIPEDVAGLRRDIAFTTHTIVNQEIQKGYSMRLNDKLFSFLRSFRTQNREHMRKPASAFAPPHVSQNSENSNYFNCHRPSPYFPAGSAISLSALASGFGRGNVVSQKMLLGILLIAPILLEEIDELLLQTTFADAELSEIKDWLLNMHFASIGFDGDLFTRQRDVFLDKIGMDLLKTHASFLFSKEIEMEETLRKWLDIWEDSVGRENIQADLACTVELLKKEPSVQLLERMKYFSQRTAQKAG